VIDLFWASSCSRCQQAKLGIKKAIEQLDNKRLSYRELDVLEEIDYAVKIGVLKTPSIAINGNLVYSSLPNINDFIITLEQALEDNP